ncbi:TadE/TadG family type IV pilus assembly protein [Fontimonas sp. SYSU GA230001]|uniref:TadE/TadG family type IV pilus assembly protein n=1 Tax=Fontimonas sp. SYSU GA230001 TaxID=3142450 RepID=UPI0032B5C9F5
MGMNATSPAGSRGRRETGAALVEFAFVFPILFLLVYGVIVYAYVYVIQQSITYAAQEAAEAAVAVSPAVDDYFTQQQTVVRATAVSALSWLPPKQRERVLGAAGEKVDVQPCLKGASGCPVDTDALRVTLRFTVRPDSSNCSKDALFPMLNLYFVGCVPPLPETLTATAVVRI